jgi:hypothetical protein
VRGDALLYLRLARRASGLLGLVSAVAGAAALVAAYLPWYQVTASVEMLGGEQSRPVASLAGWEAHPWGWVVPALAVVALVAGVALALDRPVPCTRDVELAAGLGLAAAVTAGGLLFPPVSRFDVAGSRLRELAGLADRLPRDVELTFEVRAGAGLWVTLGAAAVLVVVAFAVRER